MKHYIYFNWQDKPHNGILHLSSCGDCNNGQGKNKSKIEGQNGVWVGAFATAELGESFANRIGITLEACAVCL